MTTPSHSSEQRPHAYRNGAQTGPDARSHLSDAPREYTVRSLALADSAPLLEARHDVTALSISLRGELDIATRAPVADAMDAMLTFCASDPSSTVSLDLAGLSFLDASGMGLIIGLRAALTRRGGALEIQHPHPRVRRVFDLCDLRGVLPDDAGHDDPGTDDGRVMTPVGVPAGIAHPIGETEPDPARNSNGELSATHRSAANLPRVLDALRHLVVSAEPAVVFTSLAALCTEHICDQCTVELIEGDQARYRIQRPLASPPNSGGRVSTTGPIRQARPAHSAATTISVPFVGTPTPDQPDYRGQLKLRWDSGHPVGEADTVLATLLAERGVNTVHDGRLQTQLTAAHMRADTLQAALATNRDIGSAIGILMASHTLTRQQAFDRLRTTSQNTHRKLHDVAADVLHTGDLILDRERSNG